MGKRVFVTVHSDSLFNLYVALCHSCSAVGQHSICLLQDFDDEMFKRDRQPELTEEYTCQWLT